MRRRLHVLATCLVLFALAACSTGGTYAGARQGGADRGETNGRQLDFVSNMPEGDDWQIRIRDSSLWAAYGDGDKVKELGTANLSSKDTNRLWEVIDAIEIPGRKKGHQDEDEGWVQLRLREPGGDDEEHDLFTINVSRADAEDDEEVLALATQLQKLVEKYLKKKPEF